MKDSHSVEEKMQQLSEHIAWFDSDDFVLDEAVERFRAAEKLASEIDTQLSSFKNEITVLKEKFSED